MALKPKKCKICKNAFIPVKPLQIVCSNTCAYKYAEKLSKDRDRKVQSEYRKQRVKKKKEVMSRMEWLKLAQRSFNKFIRLRDKDLPCISCKKHHTGQYHAGHYRSTAAAPQLRFNEMNVHKQCSVCNNHKSGNLTLYRMNLIERVGVQIVEELERDSTVKKYTIDELQSIIILYKGKIKDFS